MGSKTGSGRDRAPIDKMEGGMGLGLSELKRYKAMLSDHGARDVATRPGPDPRFTRICAAIVAEREARRILTETQPCGCAQGRHWSPERGYWQCEGIEQPAALRADDGTRAAVVEALAAFVGGE